MARWLRALLVAVGVAALFAIPRVTGNEYVLALGVSFATFAVLSGGLNLVYGYTGLLSFAQVGFFGIGAVASVVAGTFRPELLLESGPSPIRTSGLRKNSALVVMRSLWARSPRSLAGSAAAVLLRSRPAEQ